MIFKFQLSTGKKNDPYITVYSDDIDVGTIGFHALKYIKSGVCERYTAERMAKAYGITKREAFHIIRDLREKNVPIVGDDRGFYLAQSTSDIKYFAEELESKGKSTIASYMILRKKMLSMIGIKPTSLPFFN